MGSASASLAGEQQDLPSHFPAIYSVSEFRFKLWNWKSTRRFVVVREEVQSNKAAVGRREYRFLSLILS